MIIPAKIARAINPEPHPLKIEIKKRDLRLWQIRNLLGGRPTEQQICRYLNGIDKMPVDLETRLAEVINQIPERR